MTLASGTRVGPFEILGLLGAGGMGEVYRARDTNLGREVALKIVPAAYTSDPDRLARFEREARVLASLNHPNIAALYGVEQSGGIRALVLELVDGETLSDRISGRGPAGPAEVLKIARQMAEALDAAHQSGVIHRDLKPANVRVSSGGVVKILDFGIAKAVRGTDPEIAEAATVAGTQLGVILGTASYMSPEQVRGQPLDKRADVWAFGCVLYELLTGRSPFAAETVSDTMARIVGADPDWGAIPAAAPAGLVRLIKRCLEKDARSRLRDLGDIDLALDAAPGAPTPKSAVRAAAIGAGVVSVLLGAAVALGVLREDTLTPTPVRFEISSSNRLGESQAFALSPDGRRLVFVGIGADGIQRLWLRSLDNLETRPLIGTENEVADNTSLWFSPDGQFIAFYAAGAVKRVDSAGGAPQLICRVPAVAVGGSWSTDGMVVVGNTGGGLLKCPAAGGDPVPVTTTESNDPAEVHLFPSFLPGGRRLIYLRVWRSNPSATGLYLADLDRAPEQQRRERLLGTNLSAEFIMGPDGSGRLLFVRDGALLLQPFDLSRGSVSGEPVPLAGGIGSFRDGALFRSSTSTLVYRGATQEYQLTWFDRIGNPIGNVGEPGPYTSVAVSPNGGHLAAVRENRLNRADSDIWIADLRRNVMTRFTSDPLPESAPAWSADGTSLTYVTGHNSGNIWTQPLLGGARSSLLNQTPALPFRINSLLTTLSATSDGRFLLFAAEGRANTRGDVWMLPLQGGGAPTTLLGQPSEEGHAMVSPDGAWVAYGSNESGVDEVYAARLARTAAGLAARGGATLVSRGGGRSPRWRGDSRELFYQSAQGAVMAVPLAGDQVGVPISLFEARGMVAHWGVLADGQRFLLAVPVTQGAPSPFTVVLDWQPAPPR